MISEHTDSDLFGIGNHKVSQLFGLVVLVPKNHPVLSLKMQKLFGNKY